MILGKRNKLKIVHNFVKTKKLVIYGGTALNSILKKDDKFYDEFELPDYDFFSYDGKKHSEELSNILINKGYSYVSSGDGMHEGTYKVFAEGDAVADITTLPKKVFNKIIGLSLK